MNAQRRRQLWWACALVGFVNLAAFGVYTLPRSLQRRNAASRVAVLRDELARENTRVAELRTRAETIERNNQDAHELLEVKVRRANASLVPILAEVESLARRQGLTVGSQGFARKPIKGLPLEELEITMPVEGTYNQVLGVVRELEHTTYFITLNAISARANGDEPSNNRISLALEFSCYFRAEPGAAAK